MHDEVENYRDGASYASNRNEMLEQQEELEFRLCSYPSSQSGRNMQDYTADKGVGANERRHRLSVLMWKTRLVEHITSLWLVILHVMKTTAWLCSLHYWEVILGSYLLMSNCFDYYFNFPSLYIFFFGENVGWGCTVVTVTRPVCGRSLYESWTTGGWRRTPFHHILLLIVLCSLKFFRQKASIDLCKKQCFSMLMYANVTLMLELLV